MIDHARGCEGRTYTCTCGYDDRRDAADGQRDALMAELAEALRACEAFLFPSSGRGTKFNGGIDDAEQLTLAALAKYEGANK